MLRNRYHSPLARVNGYMLLIVATSLLCISNIQAQVGCEFKCIDQLNLSLDQKCETEVKPAMLLSSYKAACDLAQFSIRLVDEHGIDLANATVTSDHVGQNLEYHITNSNGISCWGYVLVEYKFIPEIDCPPTLNLSCGALDILPLPQLSEVTSPCVPVTYEVYLASESRTALNCDMFHVYEVLRRYEVTDGTRVLNDCEQKIFLERPSSSNIHFPTGTTSISCSDADKYIFNDDGFPFPWITTTGSGSGLMVAGGIVENPGVPFVCEPEGVFTTIGFCPMTGSGTPLIPRGGATIALPDTTILIPGTTAQFCSTAVTYTDMIVPGDDCDRKVYRTWEMLEWWCGQELPIGGSTQLIEIRDDLAPNFTCPDDFTVTTNDYCGGEVTLPSVNATDLCNNGVSVTAQTPNGLLDSIDVLAVLDDGDNLVTYIVTDNCKNSGTCEVTVTLKDNTEPVAICERTTVISISNDGNTLVSAGIFDDGSWDECGLSHFEVRRMTTDCDPLDLEFDEYVKFCCSDLGQEIMVVFRAIDKGGNHSDCMVRVEVQDKTIPVLTCPNNMVVDCHVNYDTQNLGLTFDFADVTDNCADDIRIEEVPDIEVNQCRIGTIERTFNAYGYDGTIQSTCKQLIVIEGDLYDDGDIVWPINVAFKDEGICYPSSLNPAVLQDPHKEPTFPGIEDKCSLLGHDYEDKVVGEGECFTILRTWKVIDWCNQSNGTFAIYEMPQPQEIVVQNTQVPTIVLTDNPIEFVSSDLNCINGDVNVTVTAGPTACQGDLDWSYVIRDLGNNVMRSGTGNNFTGSLSAATYTIQWTAYNSCGLSATTFQDLIVKNTKYPIPVCMTNMVLQLNTGSATLEPSMINVGSFSPCNNPISLSFSESTTDVVRIYDCSDLGQQFVELWVTDVNSPDVQDFCISTITVRDDNDPCLIPAQRASIYGSVFTETYENLEEIEVYMDDSSSASMTNVDGEYAFMDMPKGGTYNIEPKKDTDHLNGISTLDLILIQRHILGLEILDSPHKLIAADIDNSQSISGIDLVELRKLILGIYTEFPENTSWRFIDAQHEFNESQNPWSTIIPEAYVIPSLDTDMEIDFIGVKIGDVNGSVETSLNESEVSGQSHRWPLVFQTAGNSDKKTLELKVENYESINGWQTTIELPKGLEDDIVVNAGIYSDEISYHYDKKNNTISVSCVHEEMKDLDNGTTVLTLGSEQELGGNISLNSSVTNSEAYRNYTSVPLNLENEVNVTTELSIAPNPWSDNTVLGFKMSRDSDYKIEFYDVDGKLIYTRIDFGVKGENKVEISGSEIEYQGVIYLQVTTPDGLLTQKAMRIGS